MFRLLGAVFIFASASAYAEGITSMVDASGKPSDKVLVRASVSCHMHNANADAARINCFLFDQQILVRAGETGASGAILERAKELNAGD